MQDQSLLELAGFLTNSYPALSESIVIPIILVDAD